MSDEIAMQNKTVMAAKAVSHLTPEVLRRLESLRPPRRKIELSTFNKTANRHLEADFGVHIVGIGGTGMRAIANVLVDMGVAVSGSDRADSIHLQRLRNRGVDAYSGHDYTRVPGGAAITRSTAIADDNPEVGSALDEGRPVFDRAEILAAICETKTTIAVAGTHGKTTTSSMLSVLLDELHAQPAFVVGADLARFNTGASWPAQAEIAVIEADESDGTFLVLEADHAIITSIEPDHIAFYGSEETMFAAYEKFAAQVLDRNGTVIVCDDDPGCRRLQQILHTTHPDAAPERVLSYGFRDQADFKPLNLARNGELAYPGRHNQLNATAAVAGASVLGFDSEKAREAVVRFDGVSRRYEMRYQSGGITIVDDYAHLPSEIEAVIQAARSTPSRRVVVIYQPHRYSRTRDLAETFATCFNGADELIITELYPSGEAPIPGVSAQLVIDAICAQRSIPQNQNADIRFNKVRYVKTLAQAAQLSAKLLAPGDLCLTIGAGDITKLAEQIAVELKTPEYLVHKIAQGSYSTNSAKSELEAGLDSLSFVQRNVSLADMCSYKVGGCAKFFAEVTSRVQLTQLQEILRRFRTAGQDTNPASNTTDLQYPKDGSTALGSVALPILNIGNGSNLLVADSGFDGLAIRLSGDFASWKLESQQPSSCLGASESNQIDAGAIAQEIRVFAGAGARLPVLARQFAKAAIGGFSWAVGIPGTIGGAVAMNAGGHGSETASVVQAVEVLDLETLQTRWVDAHELEFGYRCSSLGPKDLVLSAKLSLYQSDAELEGKEISNIVKWRRENQPGGQNAGSVFANPNFERGGRKISAGELIDTANAKGMAFQSAHVSEKHANFIQASPNGTAGDVLALMYRVCDLVESFHGVALQPETRLVGFKNARWQNFAGALEEPLFNYLAALCDERVFEIEQATGPSRENHIPPQRGAIDAS